MLSYVTDKFELSPFCVLGCGLLSVALSCSRILTTLCTNSGYTLTSPLNSIRSCNEIPLIQIYVKHKVSSTPLPLCSSKLERCCNRCACFSEFSRWVEDVEGGRYWLFPQWLMDAMFYYQVLRVLFGAGGQVLLWCWGSWEACGGSGAGGPPTSPFFPLWPEPPGSGCCWGAGKSSVLWCKPYPGKEIFNIYMYDASEAYLILFRDLKAVSRLVRLGLHVKKAERQNLTVPKVFQRWENLISYDDDVKRVNRHTLDVPRSLRDENLI